MGNFKHGKKAFVRYTKSGKLVQAPPYIGYKAPKTGRWVEIDLDLCCTTTTTSTTSSTTTTTTTEG